MSWTESRGQAWVVVAIALLTVGTLPAEESGDWPTFRGPGARGIAEGFSTPTTWNADGAAGEMTGVRWSVEVPGLGHSSPVIVGDRIFLLTAVAEVGDAPLMVERGGGRDAADDNGAQRWLVLCYDKRTGEERWRRVARRGNRPAPPATPRRRTPIPVWR